jgi:hypothetical protein
MNKVVRPNGKVYQPRKIRAEVLGDGWTGEEFVVVLGTHTVEEAAPYAQAALDNSPLSGGYPSQDWTRGWWRKTIRDGEPYFGWDDVHGAAGVMFEITDDEDDRYETVD